MKNWIPNLIGKIHPEAERAITSLFQTITPIPDRLQSLEEKVRAITHPGMSIDGNNFLHAEDLAKIAAELSASGSAPLNVGSLIGQLSQPQKALAQVSTVTTSAPATPGGATPQTGTLLIQNGELFYFNGAVLPGSYVPIAAQAIILYDTYSNWITSKYDPTNLPLGTLFLITDWNVLYVVESVTSVNTWVYATGRIEEVITNQPTTGFNGGALGTNDTGLSFLATDTYFEYFWTGAAWQELTPIMGGTYPTHDVTGNFPDPKLTTTGVSAATYGDATHTVTIQVDSKGRVVSVSVNAISSTPGGPAGGSLSGTYPNPTIANTLVTPGSYGDASHVAQVAVLADGRINLAGQIAINLGGFTGTLSAAITAGKNVVNGIIQP